MNIWATALKRVGNNVLQELAYHTDRNLNKPTEFFFGVTSRCTLRCKMCDFWKSDLSYKDEMTTEQWKKIIGDIHDWVGPFYAKFTGGEPFLHKGLLELVKFAKSKDCHTNIITSGRYLTPEIRNRVLESGLDSITLSLDSLRPEVHDGFRGVEGIYDKVLDAVRFFKGKLNIGIATVIFQQNLDELVPLTKWVTEEKMNCISFQPVEDNFASNGNGSDWHQNVDHFVTDSDKLDKVIDELISMKRAHSPIGNPENHLEMIRTYFRNPANVRENEKCLVGQTNFFIGSKGEVRMCLLWEEFDNYFNYNSPEELWGSQTAQETRTKIKNCREKCMLNCHRTRSLGEQTMKFIKVLRNGKF